MPFLLAPLLVGLGGTIVLAWLGRKSKVTGQVQGQTNIGAWWDPFVTASEAAGYLAGGVVAVPIGEFLRMVGHIPMTVDAQIDYTIAHLDSSWCSAGTLAYIDGVIGSALAAGDLTSARAWTRLRAAVLRLCQGYPASGIGPLFGPPSVSPRAHAPSASRPLGTHVVLGPGYAPRRPVPTRPPVTSQVQPPSAPAPAPATVPAPAVVPIYVPQRGGPASSAAAARAAIFPSGAPR